MWKLAALAVTGAAFNSLVRGGAIKIWFPNARFLKIINAVAFGIAAYLSYKNPVYASLMALSMYIGQAPAIFHPDSDKYKAQRMLGNWAQVVFERGLFWALPLALVSAYWAHWWALSWLLIAPWMVVSYLPDYLDLKWPQRWACCEAIFGLALWSILAYILGHLPSLLSAGLLGIAY